MLCAGLDGEAAVKSSSAATRTPAVRAAELAAVSLRLYEAGGRAIHVPLAPDNGLIVILKEVLGTASSSSMATPSAKEQKELAQLREGAADVAQALLEMILQQHQQVSHVVRFRSFGAANFKPGVVQTLPCR
jgi:hypothetical protein